jgi:hypothetical protein
VEADGLEQLVVVGGGEVLIEEDAGHLGDERRTVAEELRVLGGQAAADVVTAEDRGRDGVGCTGAAYVMSQDRCRTTSRPVCSLTLRVTRSGLFKAAS